VWYAQARAYYFNGTDFFRTNQIINDFITRKCIMKTKKRNNRRSRVMILHIRMCFTAAFFLLISAITTAQDKVEGPVPGIINIKFKQEVLHGEVYELRSQEIVSPELRTKLSENGFERGEKIFRHFESRDTMAISRFTGEPVTLLDLSRWYTIKVADTVNTVRLAEKLMELPGVEAASPEFLMYSQQVFPNDPRFQSNHQWGLYNWNNPGKDIHAPQAWQINKGRSDIIVAVIDGGVDYNHPDLDPGNRSRIIQGYDVADNNSNPMDDIPSQYSFANHGTAVAGIIGAITDNGQKVAGVMWNVKIMPVKVAHTSSPWWDPFGWSMGGAPHGKVAAGVDWARQNGADIINLSLGSDGVSGKWYSTFYNNPITEATYNAYVNGVLIVAAMGNDNAEKEIYPAGFPWTVAVGASNQNDQRVSVSTWGSNFGNHIDVVAPGINYYSTRRNNQDGAVSGTSAAAPVVSGVAGLVLSQSKNRGLNLTNDDIRNVIRVTADDINQSQYPGYDKFVGYGRVNAYEALKLLSAPNIVEHGTKIGGSSILTWDSHSHTFYRGMGTLATGTYFGVKQYKVTGQINFSNTFTSPPVVWVRDRTSKGWNYANPNMQTPWFKITNVTNSGFTYETVVYYIGSNSIGQTINKYYPASPSNVRVDYTAVGRPAGSSFTVTISGPSIASVGQDIQLTANVSGGSGSFIYQWYRVSGGTETLIGSGKTITYFTGSTPQILTFKVYVTDIVTGVGRTAQHNVNVQSGGPIPPSASDDLIVALPEEYGLTANYPNPFNPSTAIKFQLPEQSRVSLVIYDMMGREVCRLVDGVVPPGYHEAFWDGRNSNGNPAASGVYVYRFSAQSIEVGSGFSGLHESRTMLLVK
jgi:subtilisin family serine protease